MKSFTYERANSPAEAAAAAARVQGAKFIAGGTNLLYRNRGDGTFEDVSEASGIARPRGSSTMVFVGSNWRPTGSYGMGAAAADLAAEVRSRRPNHSPASSRASAD